MKSHIAAAVAGLLLASPVSATVQTFNFVARVDQTGAFVPAGTMITGSFSYDDTLAPTAYFTDASGARALYTHPSIALSASFSGLTYSSGNNQALVYDASAGVPGSDESDAFSIGSYAGSAQYDLYIWQPDRAWLTDTGLPTSYPTSLWQGPFADPNDDDNVTVPHGEFSFWDADRSRTFTALVLSVAPASAGAVPEPASWMLMIAGFGLVGAVMRRNSASPVAAGA